MEASARETSLQSKLEVLTGNPAATAPSPEEYATKKELGHVLQRIEEMNEVTINLQMELDNYLSKLRNDLDEPHSRNQQLPNQNEELNMNDKDLEPICGQCFLDEPHNRNQELRNQNEELNMNVKDLETICGQCCLLARHGESHGIVSRPPLRRKRDETANQRSLRRLRTACERAKRT